VGIYLQGLQKCSKSKKGIKNPEFHAESFGKVAKRPTQKKLQGR
jgi:hypothetical protein